MAINSLYRHSIKNNLKSMLSSKATITYFLVLTFTLSFMVMNADGSVRDSTQVSLANPYQTVFTHLYNLDDKTYHPEISAQAFLHPGITEKEAVDAAIKLKQVFDGEGIYIDVEEIPKNPNFIDSTNNRHQYILTTKMPEIYLVKSGTKWLYSKATIKVIYQEHSRIYPFGSDLLLEILPQFGDSKFLGLYVWQLFGILIIVVLSFIVHKIFTLVFENIIIKYLRKLGYERIAINLVKPIAKPISYLIIFPILIILVPVLQLPVSVSRYIIIGLKAFWPIFLTIVFYRLVDVFGVYMVKVAEKTESTLDDQLVPLVRKILKTFVVIIGVLFVLMNLNISIIPFITGLSIGGLAFALAAQDTIKNFFGSLMIFIDKPFQVGNWITSGDIDGSVEEVGLRSTRIRTFRNSLIYVPNGILADRTIDNHGLRQYRRFYSTLSITYDTPPALIEVFIEGLNKIVAAHPHVRKDYYNIYLNNFGDSSLNIMFYIFFEAPTWPLELKYRHEIMISILQLAEKLNVRFAFPTRTLHMENFPEKVTMTPQYKLTKDEMKKEVDSFFKEEKE